MALDRQRDHVAGLHRGQPGQQRLRVGLDGQRVLPRLPAETRTAAAAPAAPRLGRRVTSSAPPGSLSLKAVGLGRAAVPGALVDPAGAVPVAEREVVEPGAGRTVGRQRVGRIDLLGQQALHAAVRQADAQAPGADSAASNHAVRSSKVWRCTSGAAKTTKPRSLQSMLRGSSASSRLAIGSRPSRCARVQTDSVSAASWCGDHDPAPRPAGQRVEQPAQRALGHGLRVEHVAGDQHRVDRVRLRELRQPLDRGDARLGQRHGIFGGELRVLAAICQSAVWRRKRGKRATPAVNGVRQRPGRYSARFRRLIGVGLAARAWASTDACGSRERASADARSFRIGPAHGPRHAHEESFHMGSTPTERQPVPAPDPDSDPAGSTCAHPTPPRAPAGTPWPSGITRSSPGWCCRRSRGSAPRSPPRWSNGSSRGSASSVSCRGCASSGWTACRTRWRPRSTTTCRTTSAACRCSSCRSPRARPGSATCRRAGSGPARRSARCPRRCRPRCCAAGTRATASAWAIRAWASCAPSRRWTATPRWKATTTSTTRRSRRRRGCASRATNTGRRSIRPGPALPSAQWPAARREKARRNYAMEYVRTAIPVATELLGDAQAGALLRLTGRLVGMQHYHAVAALAQPAIERWRTDAGLEDTGLGRFVAFAGALAQAQGDRVEASLEGGVPRGLRQHGWSLADRRRRCRRPRWPPAAGCMKARSPLRSRPGAAAGVVRRRTAGTDGLDAGRRGLARSAQPGGAPAESASGAGAALQRLHLRGHLGREFARQEADRAGRPGQASPARACSATPQTVACSGVAPRAARPQIRPASTSPEPEVPRPVRLDRAASGARRAMRSRWSPP